MYANDGVWQAFTNDETTNFRNFSPWFTVIIYILERLISTKTGYSMPKIIDYLHNLKKS